ncbi:MAG: LytTR family transcriptional regulator [Oscillospiraceae bacterium]|nr:LytTR family transcriptional regulator [Oscillospiraceae bacterium]
MKFKLIIDPEQEETVVATVRERSAFTDQLEALVLGGAGADSICGYTDEEWKLLAFQEIACITVLDSKVYAIDSKNRRYRLKQRLYEIEGILPSYFLRINKSTLANEKQLDRFTVAFSGAVDAVFKCGYREYVSRRCFTQIKRRFQVK